MYGYSIAPTSLLQDARYEKMAAAFGAEGYNAQTPTELQQNLEKALKQKQKPVLINVRLNPEAGKKPQVINFIVQISNLLLLCLPGELLADQDKDKVVTCTTEYNISEHLFTELLKYFNEISILLRFRFITWHGGDATFRKEEISTQ